MFGIRSLRRIVVVWTAGVMVAVPSCVVRTEVAGPEPDAPGTGIVPEDLPPGVRYVGPGADAATYLRPVTARIVIEVDQVEGVEISQSSLSHLQRVLSSVADKPVNVETSTIPSDRSDYAPEDLRALEEKHRDTFTEGDTASMYVLAADGAFREHRGVIGVAFSGSSFALFLEEINSRNLGDTAAVERAVLVHETGHLLALVNAGYESPRDREDPDRPNHSANRQSVMHWAVESIDIVSVLGGGPPDDFDEADRADLADIASGAITPEFGSSRTGTPGGG